MHDPTLPIWPVVGTLPANRALMAGYDVNLRVMASGGLLRYQWQCNGTNIPRATGSTLTLRSAATSQSGSISVLVSNAAGIVRSTAMTLLVWPRLWLTQNGNDGVATWEGSFVVQSATNPAGPFSDVPGASSPYTNDLRSIPARFLRLRLPVGPLSLSRLDHDNLLLNWPGPFTLQSSPSLSGPYTDVPGATHPQTNNVAGFSQRFFRLRF